MEQEIRKKRQVNFELLRILCMYMIVIGHCLFHGRVTAKLGYGTVNYFLSYLIQSFSVVHVNCFIMIGGYFAIDRAFKAERAVKLWKQVAFYSVGIFLLCAIFGSIAPVDVVKAVLPISSKTYWFASVYMGLAAPDAISWHGGSADYQKTVSVPAFAAGIIFECQSYDFSDGYLWNFQWP